MQSTFATAVTVATKRGFTLIELSIVLVIIGLIVGGVLVGRDLIQAAGVRAQISQIEQFNNAVIAFRTKYSCMPGDCSNATIVLGATLSNGDTVYNGNGDGKIDSIYYSPMPYGENQLFFSELAAVKMLSGNFTNSNGKRPSDIIGRGVVDMYYDNVNNFWNLKKAAGFDSLTPIEASAIDKKIDDGVATTGKVLGNDGDGSSNTYLVGEDLAYYDNCYNFENVSGYYYPQSQYNYSTSKSVGCTLYIRTPWN